MCITPFREIYNHDTHPSTAFEDPSSNIVDNVIYDEIDDAAYELVDNLYTFTYGLYMIAYIMMVFITSKTYNKII